MIVFLVVSGYIGIWIVATVLVTKMDNEGTKDITAMTAFIGFSMWPLTLPIWVLWLVVHWLLNLVERR